MGCWRLTGGEFGKIGWRGVGRVFSSFCGNVEDSKLVYNKKMKLGRFR